MNPQESPAGPGNAVWEVDASTLRTTVVHITRCLTSRYHPLIKGGTPSLCKNRKCSYKYPKCPLHATTLKGYKNKGEAAFLRGTLSCVGEWALQELRIISVHTGFLWPPFLLKPEPSLQQTLPFLACLNPDCLYKY